MKSYRFVHLNVHSHYSINDGCASIRELVDAPDFGGFNTFMDKTNLNP